MAAAGTGLFRFLELPAELPELIYFHAIQPVQTFKTATTPAFVNGMFVPEFSQLCRAVRAESLQYELKYRPVDISLHSPANLNLAQKWALEPASHASEYRTYIFTGGIAAAENDFYQITVARLKEAPFFSVTAKAGGASDMADRGANHIKGKLSDQLLMANGRNGTLSAERLCDLIGMVFTSSQALVALVYRQGSEGIIAERVRPICYGWWLSQGEEGNDMIDVCDSTRLAAIVESASFEQSTCAYHKHRSILLCIILQELKQ